MSEASDNHRQAIEQIMRKAESMGLDPQRVASALEHRAPAATEYQAVAEVQPRSWFRRSLTRGVGKLAERRRD